MFAEVEVQRALVGVLAGIGLRVHDAAPQENDGGNASVFPYVEVGYIVFTPFDTARETGFEYVARIHTRSRSHSMLETKSIQGEIYRALHRVQLDVPGSHHVSIQRESSDVSRTADNNFHGLCEYRGLIETI
jgi:hypothetical protein